MRQGAFYRRLRFVISLSILLLAMQKPLFGHTAMMLAEPEPVRLVNFSLVRGLVLIEAELNGVKGDFILDTGSPMLILNRKASELMQFEANTLQGALSGEWTTCDLSWAGIHRFNLKALALDISHLEGITGKPIMGLVGYEFFGEMNLYLDFNLRKASLMTTAASDILNNTFIKENIPFTLEGHLPVIEAQIGSNKFRLGLDTGAGTNLLHLNRIGDIEPELLTPAGEAGLNGLAGSQKVLSADIVETTIGASNYWNMRFVFTDISNLENLVSNQVDGLLGFPFFEGGKFSINYQEKILSVWK